MQGNILDAVLCVCVSKQANRPENRAQRPWIITMGHRPMYCSNDDGDDCTNFQSYVRDLKSVHLRI